MSSYLAVVVFLSLQTLAYPTTGKDGVYLPNSSPSPPREQERSNALSSVAISDYLSRVNVTHAFSEFQGKNEALAKSADNADGLVKVAAGYPVDIAGDLLGTGFEDGAYLVHVCGITSIDAQALRLQVDLSEAATREEVWTIDPVSKRAFGPYTGQSAVSGGRWLPAIPGDTAILVVRSAGNEPPKIRVTALAHFYRTQNETKELTCKIDVACEPDPLIQQVASAVAYITVPVIGTLDMGTASGSLLNASTTEDEEPLLLTANHVISDASQAQNSDIIWDYRSAQCGGSSVNLSSLPRSQCDEMVVTDSTLDITLLRLDGAPNGAFGRAYLGWDSRTPQLGEKIIGIHLSGAKNMSISYGTVQQVNREVNIAGGPKYVHEIQVGWDSGVTETSASGSCLLYVSSNYRVGGVLSNGTDQQCGAGPATNVDCYASFCQFLKSNSVKSYFPEANLDVRYEAPSNLPKTGSLKVTIGPAAACTAGAQWDLDNGAWCNSGDTLSGITAGGHTVSFKAISAAATTSSGCSGSSSSGTAWQAAASQDVTIVGGQTATITVQYTATEKALQAGLAGDDAKADSALLLLMALVLAGLHRSNLKKEVRS